MKTSCSNVQYVCLTDCHGKSPVMNPNDRPTLEVPYGSIFGIQRQCGFGRDWFPSHETWRSAFGRRVKSHPNRKWVCFQAILKNIVHCSHHRHHLWYWWRWNQNLTDILEHHHRISQECLFGGSLSSLSLKPGSFAYHASWCVMLPEKCLSSIQINQKCTGFIMPCTLWTGVCMCVKHHKTTVTLPAALGRNADHPEATLLVGRSMNIPWMNSTQKRRFTIIYSRQLATQTQTNNCLFDQQNWWQGVTGFSTCPLSNSNLLAWRGTVVLRATPAFAHTIFARFPSTLKRDIDFKMFRQSFSEIIKSPPR